MGLCADKVCAPACVCLTCDPGATLAAYGSNWAARKLTKCQWSVVPQEVIDCGPRGQWGSSVFIYFLPQTIVSAWITLLTIYYVFLKWCQLLKSVLQEFCWFNVCCFTGVFLKWLCITGLKMYLLCWEESYRSPTVTDIAQEKYCFSVCFPGCPSSLPCWPSLVHFRPSYLCLVICLCFLSPCLSNATTLCLVIFHCQWAKLGGMVWAVGCEGC